MNFAQKPLKKLLRKCAARMLKDDISIEISGGKTSEKEYF